MRKYCLLVFICLLPAYLVAQNNHQMQQEENQYAQIPNDSLFKELKAIRSLQEKAKAERDTIRAKMKKREAELQEHTEADMSNEYGAILQVENNTRQHWWYDDWNFFGIFTFIVAVISAWFAIITYRAQKKTEEHTTNAPKEVQLGVLNDLPRHFYRNLVCTCAMILNYKFGKGQEKLYPSESNLMKLQTLPDDVVLPVDIDTSKEDNAYQHMHELKLLLRNYNIEVEVASEHLSRKGITDDSLVQDFDNILYKPLFLTRGAFDFRRSLERKTQPEITKEFLVEDSIRRIVQEHFRKLKIQSNFVLLFKKEIVDKLKLILKESKADFQIIDKKNGIVRSINYFLDYVSKVNRDNVSVINRHALIDKIIEDLTQIDRKNDKDSKDEWTPYFKGIKSSYPGILSIENKEQFVAFCLGVGYINDEDKYKCEELYNYIAPYLNYLRQEKWETLTLLNYILAIDAAIETDRIGMVNFS